MQKIEKHCKRNQKPFVLRSHLTIIPIQKNLRDATLQNIFLVVLLCFGWTRYVNNTCENGKKFPCHINLLIIYNSLHPLLPLTSKLPSDDQATFPKPVAHFSGEVLLGLSYVQPYIARQHIEHFQYKKYYMSSLEDVLVVFTGLSLGTFTLYLTFLYLFKDVLVIFQSHIYIIQSSKDAYIMAHRPISQLITMPFSHIFTIVN